MPILLRSCTSRHLREGQGPPRNYPHRYEKGGVLGPAGHRPVRKRPEFGAWMTSWSRRCGRRSVRPWMPPLARARSFTFVERDEQQAGSVCSGDVDGAGRAAAQVEQGTQRRHLSSAETCRTAKHRGSTWIGSARAGTRDTLGELWGRTAWTVPGSAGGGPAPRTDPRSSWLVRHGVRHRAQLQTSRAPVPVCLPPLRNAVEDFQVIPMDGPASYAIGRLVGLTDEFDQGQSEPPRLWWRPGNARPGSRQTPTTLLHATISPGARLTLPWQGLQRPRPRPGGQRHGQGREEAVRQRPAGGLRRLRQPSGAGHGGRASRSPPRTRWK